MKELPPRRKSRFYSRPFAALFSLSILASATAATAQNAGVIEFESASYAVNEQAASHTVKVKRTGGSDGAVSVNFATSDGTAMAATALTANDYTPTSGTLVFQDGETEKAITVQIVVPTSETVAEANETFHLTLTSPTGGAALGTVAETTFTLNDTPLFFAPPDQTTTVGTATSAVGFTISDAETPAENLIVTAVSNNPTVLPDSGIVLGGSGANRTVTLTPAVGQTGAAQVILAVTDEGGATMTRTFYLRVGNAATGTALAITGTTPANSVPDLVIVADDSFTFNYTTASSGWVTNVTFVELDNLALIGSHGTGSTSDLRTQPGTSGATARSLRIRGNDNSTSVGAYGRANVTLAFTGAGAPSNTHTFNVRVNPRAVVDNQLLAIPGTTSIFDVLANDATPLIGHSFAITDVSTPAHGTLTITPDGQYVRYTPTNASATSDSFTYTVTVSSSDLYNGYTFTGTGSVKIGGYVVVDSAVSGQHTDIDIDFVDGRWTQNLRTDAFIMGAVQSGASAQTVLDADEGSLFLDPSTKQARPAGALFDVLGVPEGADVWRGPETTNGNKPYIGIANEATSDVSIDSYTPANDPRATSNSAWVRTDLVGFTGPGNFAAFYGGDVTFDTLDGLNSANDASSGGNPTDTSWGFAGSHAHLAWYFTAPGRYTLTFRSSVRVNGEFITSPDTTFTFDVENMAGDVRLFENPPRVQADSITVAEDSGATTMDVLANDSSEADPHEVLSVTAVTQATSGSVTITGGGVSYTPALDYNGADSFTYTVTDEHGGTATGTVNVTVTPVDDEPTITAISGPGVDTSGHLIMSEDGDITVNFTVSDAVTPGGSLTVTGTRTNTTLFASIGTSSTSRLQLATVNGGERSLRVRPAANLSGTSSVTLTVTDGEGYTATRTFEIVVNPVNDMPSFAKGANTEHINSNTGLQSFSGWATAINDGDAEVTQALAFQVSVTSGASIFAQPPTVSADGTLVYTLSGTPGIATVEVRLTDDLTGGGDALTTPAQSFTVASFSGAERRVIAGVHADAISVFEDGGQISLESMADIDDEFEVRLSPNEVIFDVEEATRTTVPSGPEYAFLGAAGSDVWTAPEENPIGAVLWPGFNTENVAAGTLDGDQVTLRLESVAGPGTLHIYQTDAFSAPVRLLSSTGSDYRTWTLATGQHVHANWAFSAAGTYVLTFSASATINGTPVTALQSYTFVVGNMPVGTATTTTLAAAPAATEIGSPVTLTATVTPSSAEGYVEFLNGTTVLGEAISNAGTVSFTTTGLGIGMHALTARFVPGWAHDFATSTSDPVNVTITEPGGVPFTITGVSSSYQVGQTLNALIAGYTLQAGQEFRWQTRPIGTANTPSSLQTSTSYTYSQAVTIVNDGYEIQAVVLLDGNTVAQTPWVPIHVEQDGGVAPVLTVVSGNPAELYPGDTTRLEASELNLAGNETTQWVRRNSSGNTWSTSFSAPSLGTTTGPTWAEVTGNIGLSAWGDLAIRVLRDGTPVRQSAPVTITPKRFEVMVQGLEGLYMEGATLNLSAQIHPVRQSDTDFIYRWQFSKSSGFSIIAGNGTMLAEGVGAPPPLTQVLNMADHDGGYLRLEVFNPDFPGLLNGTAYQHVAASETMRIYVTDDPNTQLFFFANLSGHYHQGDNVNLSLTVAPDVLAGDEIIWEWKWPGQDWTPFPGASGKAYPVKAEQALDEVQVRATLDFVAEGKPSVLAPAVTIHVDDHGSAARQQPTISGATSYHAGEQITLTRELPANGPTLLTTHRWERKGSGDSTFSSIPGQAGSTLTIPATLADNGAEYRVSILKPDGTVAYGPSPAVVLSVTSSSYVPFSMLANYGGVMGSSANSIAIGDVTGDGLPDMVTAGGAPGTLALIKNGGGGQFLAGELLNEGSGFYAFGAHLADVDGDGDLDILTGEADIDTMNGDTSNGEVACYVNDGTGNFNRQSFLSGLASLATYIEVADLNGDGRPDVLHRISASTVVYRPGLPAGGFGDAVTVTDTLAPSDYPSVAIRIADKDGDNDQDIFLLDDGVSQLRVLENNGTGSFVLAPGNLPSGLYASIRDVADVTGDGRPDVVIIGFADGVGYQGTVAIQQANGSFAAPTPLLPDSAMYAAAVGDFNQDTTPDLVSVIYGGSGYVLRLHLGTGGGEFSAPQTLLPQLWYPNDLKIQDLDGNGSSDIAVAVSSDTNPVYVLLNSSGSDPRQVLSPAGRVYTEGDPLELSLYFGSPAMVTGTPRVALQVGASTVYADYVSGAGTPTLLFRYTVAAVDLDLDGVQLVSGTAIDLNGGTLLDHSGNAFSLEIPATPFNGVVVNGGSPLVQSITRADSTPTNAPTVCFNVQFTEAVEGVDATDFELVQGGEAFEGAAIQSVTGTGSSYQVIVTTGTGSGVLGLHVKAAASIAATSGAPFSKPYQGGEVYTLRRGPAKMINTFYTSEHGHADFRPVLEDGLFEWVFVGDHEHAEGEEDEHDDDHGEYLHSDELVTHVGAPALVARGVASSYDFLGVGAGENLYIITSNSKEGVPYLGWSGESVPTGVLARYLNTDPRVNATNAYMKVQLAAVRSTSGGEFSIYSISSGNPRVWMATSDGISNTDAFFLRPGSHSHLNVGFSKPGIYEVDVFVSAYRDTNGNGTYDEVKDPYIEGGIQTMIYAVDPAGGLAPVTFAADMAGSAPVAVADSFYFGAGESYTGNILSNDTDPQGDELTALIKTQATHGTVTLAADGSFTYEPHVFGIQATDSFAYYAHDSKGGWAEATVALTISALAPQEPMQPGEVVDLAVSLPEGSKATVRGLPPGLKYNAKTHTITGRARTQGSYLISIQVKDADGNVSTMLVPLVVKGLPTDIVGKFVGYLSGQLSGSLQERNGGRVDLTVTALGSYSLKVTHGATTTSQSGYLDVTEELPKIQVPLRSGFNLTMSLADGTLSGTATLADVSIPVTGWRGAYDAKLNPAVEQQGYYTVALMQSSTQSGHPQGHGFLAIKIGADGKTTATGKAADGSSITSTSFLGTDNKVLVQTPLYSKKGAVIGALDLTVDATGSYLENELEGTLVWSKPAVLTGRSSLESGYALPLAGYGRYMGVDTKGLIMGLPAPGVLTQLHFDSPALTGMSPNEEGIELQYPSMKCLVPTNPAKTTLKVTKTTGAISGAFSLADDRIKRAGKFQGMVVRDDTGTLHAVGYTLLPMLPDAGQSASKTQIVSGAVEWLAE